MGFRDKLKGIFNKIKSILRRKKAPKGPKKIEIKIEKKVVEELEAIETLKAEEDYSLKIKSMCPEGQEEVQDIILVRDTSYEESKKRRTREISLYVEIDDIPVECVNDDTCLDKVAEEAFELAAERLEGGAFYSLLHAAFNPLDYSVDSESAHYCSSGSITVSRATISITGRGRTRHYSEFIGESIRDKVL